MLAHPPMAKYFRNLPGIRKIRKQMQEISTR
jgi:hypothetical protein